MVGGALQRKLFRLLGDGEAATLTISGILAGASATSPGADTNSVALRSGTTWWW